ncbi:hypothetical protein LJC46_04305 [Desulfovibrio sp. OttesenSCG-928-G15]|nr:hypothetical protein [Desulfovibrio sp. OttesenSCG-928-G15]
MTRQEAHAGYKMVLAAIPEDDGAARAAAMRGLCLCDLFFLMVFVLGRADMDNDWCFDRCREVQMEPDGCLDLWAREHYKSTIITVGKTIQDVLADPEITVGILSYNQDIASSFLVQIKSIFEGCEALKALFPDVLWSNPEKEAPVWNTEALIVKRKTIPKEATVEALPLHKGVGKHFSLLVYDDVVTPDSVTTPDMIKKTTENWQLSLNIGANGGKRRMIGTRYHFNDTYSTVLKQGSAKPRIYPATDSGTYEGNPVFLTREQLDEKRRDMGPYVFGCQMLQNPKADAAQGFRDEWLRYWEPKRQDGMNIYILVDPASAKKKDSDYTVMWVIGLHDDGCYYVIDGLRDRLNLTQRTAALFRFHRQYRPLAVGYEQYGMQADIEHIKYVQDQDNYHFSITVLGGSMPKYDRVRCLVPIFEQGRMFLPGRIAFKDIEGAYRDMVREFREEEYIPFPVCAHDDMLDCLARIVDAQLGAAFPSAAYTPDAERYRNGPPLAEMEWSPW